MKWRNILMETVIVYNSQKFEYNRRWTTNYSNYRQLRRIDRLNNSVRVQ